MDTAIVPRSPAESGFSPDVALYLPLLARAVGQMDEGRFNATWIRWAAGQPVPEWRAELERRRFGRGR